MATKKAVSLWEKALEGERATKLLSSLTRTELVLSFSACLDRSMARIRQRAQASRDRVSRLDGKKARSRARDKA